VGMTISEFADLISYLETLKEKMPAAPNKTSSAIRSRESFVVAHDTKVEQPAWKLVWSDEFDGTENDRKKWDYDVGNGFFNYEANTWINGWGNNELQGFRQVRFGILSRLLGAVDDDRCRGQFVAEREVGCFQLLSVIDDRAGVRLGVSRAEMGGGRFGVSAAFYQAEADLCPTNKPVCA